MSGVGPLGTVVPMGQVGDSGDALESARQVLAARDADLADADRGLADAVAAAHALAVEALSRIDAISDDVEAAATDQPKNGPAGARDVSRHLVAKNREVAEVITEAEIAVQAKTVALRELTGRYRPPASS